MQTPQIVYEYRDIQLEDAARVVAYPNAHVTFGQLLQSQTPVLPQSALGTTPKRSAAADKRLGTARQEDLLAAQIAEALIKESGTVTPEGKKKTPFV